MITGNMKSIKDLTKRLQNLSVKTVEGSLASVVDATLAVHTEAIKSIQEHRSSGRVYKRGNTYHIASAPGNPPNTDKGDLVKSIAFNIDVENLTGEVGSNSPYAAIQEFGSSRQEPRPWLLPALAKIAPEYAKRLKEILTKLYKSGGV
jgi:HK97 gp10 family phage protein